jgi:uncharacterized protein
MKKLFLVAGLVIASIIGESQLLYSIQKSGSTDISYLYGTIHLGDSVLLSWDDNFLDAFYSCDGVVGELNLVNDSLDIQQNMMNILAPVIMAPDNSVVSPDTMKFITDQLSMEFDSATAIGLTQLRPFWAMIMIEQLRKIKNANLADTLPYEEKLYTDTIYYMPIDLQLQYMAVDYGMEVAGLETMQTQIDLVLKLGENVTWKTFYTYLEKPWEINALSSDVSAEGIRENYIKQDGLALANIFEESGISEADKKLFFSDRNINMHQGMIDFMSDHKKYFFAVGAGHLFGTMGLLDLLSKSGYTITPVPFTFTKM